MNIYKITFKNGYSLMIKTEEEINPQDLHVLFFPEIDTIEYQG